MRVEMAFGRTGLGVALPEEWDVRVLEARGARALDDPAAALRGAVARPVAGPGLRELAAGKRTAAISVCDITRPAPNRQTLPVILEALEQAGIGPDGVTILIATGLHREATAAEIREIAGDDIASRYRVGNHDARRREDHVYLGDTRRGTPVWIDRRFVEADVHITLGFIEPHLMLGYSGGRKLVAPGLAAQETIKVIHSPRFMREAAATEGSIENNPLHAELCEIASIARHDFMLDVALARDRRIAGVFAGEPIAAHRAGVEFVSGALLERLDDPVDAVITSAAGYPLDLTFYQSIKGITAAHHIVKPGGSILVMAECREGVGAHEFGEMVRTFGTYDGFLEAIRDREVVVDQWQLEKLALVAARHEILFFTPGLPEEFRGHFAGRMFVTAEQAVAALAERLPSGAKVAAIPEGPYVLARVEAPVEEGVLA